MVTGIRLTNCENCTFELTYGEGITNAVSMTGSKGIHFPSVDFGVDVIEQHQKLYAGKVGRNQPCPCGSGIKAKKCKGASTVSTGIKSNNSQFSVGKATIVADVGVDLVDSKAHIGEYLFLSSSAPDLRKLLQEINFHPSEEIVKEAISDVKTTGSKDVLETSRLRAWANSQGLNAAHWMQLTSAIVIAALGA